MFRKYLLNRRKKKIQLLRAKAAGAKAIYDTQRMICDAKSSGNVWDIERLNENAGKAAYYTSLADALEKGLPE